MMFSLSLFTSAVNTERTEAEDGVGDWFGDASGLKDQMMAVDDVVKRF